MVYVDNARNPFGRMLMCHMVADTSEELRDMARRIGLDARHIQHPGSDNEHFDLSLSYRRKAVNLGAREIDSRGLVKIIRAKRKARALT